VRTARRLLLASPSGAPEGDPAATCVAGAGFSEKRPLRHGTSPCGTPERSFRKRLRKEVIQPQVPLRLPCYDFTPVADLTVDGCLSLRC
jgi:hypothetical protein